jgi:hypothetical protein
MVSHPRCLDQNSFPNRMRLRVTRVVSGCFSRTRHRCSQKKLPVSADRITRRAKGSAARMCEIECELQGY